MIIVVILFVKTLKIVTEFIKNEIKNKNEKIKIKYTEN